MQLPTWCLLHILVHATLFPCLVNITRNDLVLRFNRNQSIFQMLFSFCAKLSQWHGRNRSAILKIFVLYCMLICIRIQTGIFVIKILNEYILCKCYRQRIHRMMTMIIPFRPILDSTYLPSISIFKIFNQT